VVRWGHRRLWRSSSSNKFLVCRGAGGRRRTDTTTTRPFAREIENVENPRLCTQQHCVRRAVRYGVWLCEASVVYARGLTLLVQPHLSWWRGTVVERRSLTGELSLSAALDLQLMGDH